MENNHENLRKIFPKGESMDAFSQRQVNVAISHLNSIARVSLNDIPAMTLFERIYGKLILGKLELRLIPKDEVCLTPDVLLK